MAPKGKPAEVELTDLDKMFARAKDFTAGGHLYKVLPLLVTDAITYGEEVMWAQNPLWLVAEGEGRDRFVFWLNKAVRTEKGDPVTFEVVTKDGWTTADVTGCLKMLAGVSG